MNKSRLEAFSDGVIAIIITIMVLEIKVPHGEHFADLLPLWPVFLSYVLSFANVGTYWVNHHHMLHATKHVNGPILWTNMNLLFWLSLMPFTTGWMGENHFAAIPMALYALDLGLCGLSYVLLQQQIIRAHGKDSVLSAAIGKDTKGKVSMAGYVLAVPLALFDMTSVAGAILDGIACMWLIPDRRIERKLVSE
ncbi:MAG: DUF1211 domain-containing protein [Rhodoferax sp.]|nr:DUF1211 domain-containing protein [Rhodoferax sp.]